MNLIVETDLGHDPDDFFTLLWLLSVGVNIGAVIIHPGDEDQVAIAAFVRKNFNLDFPIGVSKLDRKKLSSGSIHYDILKKYKYPITYSHDGLGSDIIEQTLKSHDCEFLVIGPVTSLSNYIKNNDPVIEKATMQGGFLPYSIHCPKITLDKFEGQEWVPTFNLNGDRPAGVEFCNAKIQDRRFVGKNICHTVVYDKSIHERLKPHNEPSKMFKEAMDIYLQRHEEKKFHDPTAAVCHLNPTIATWVRGNCVKFKGGWTTELNDNGDHIIADIEYEQLWDHITEFK